MTSPLQNKVVPALALLLPLLLSCCANWAEDTGVDNHWRDANTPAWVNGQSTNEDIMAALGPPSQIISLNEQVVYYYMRERTRGSGYYFLVYNNSRETTEYDRAIYFFDDQGVLLRYSYSETSLPREDD